MPAPLVPECNDSTGICEVHVDGSSLPRKIANFGGAFVIQTRQRPDKRVTEAEAVARLMIQGTFGMTKAGIDGVLDEFGVGANNGGQNSNDRDASAAAAWFAAEVAKPPSFLRQRYRLNTNPRMFPDGDYNLGEEYGRCDVGSRWHLYAFTYWDKGKHIDMKAVTGGFFQLFVDGVLRTELPAFLSYTWTANHEDVQFYICGVEETSDQNDVSAIFMYPTSDASASCSSYNYASKGHKGVNPLINFEVPNGDSTQIYGAGQVMPRPHPFIILMLPLPSPHLRAHSYPPYPRLALSSPRPRLHVIVTSPSSSLIVVLILSYSFLSISSFLCSQFLFL